MREIKFRAWFLDCDTKILYSIYFGFSDISQGSIMGPDSEWNSLLKAIAIEQFTGLHDKNGKEIYEGDCFRFTGACFTKGYSRVLWSDREAMFIDVSGCPICDRADIEVIGNIHENPELVKSH